jgi:hypothetical protein
MYESMSLEELKTEARKQSHLVIRRDGEISWRPLKNWKGHPTSSVTYYLIGNRVMVRVGSEKDVHWYTLS